MGDKNPILLCEAGSREEPASSAGILGVGDMEPRPPCTVDGHGQKAQQIEGVPRASWWETQTDPCFLGPFSFVIKKFMPLWTHLSRHTGSRSWGRVRVNGNPHLRSPQMMTTAVSIRPRHLAPASCTLQGLAPAPPLLLVFFSSSPPSLRTLQLHGPPSWLCPAPFMAGSFSPPDLADLSAYQASCYSLPQCLVLCCLSSSPNLLQSVHLCTAGQMIANLVPGRGQRPWAI